MPGLNSRDDDEPDRLHPVHIELWCPNGPEIHWQVTSVRGREALAEPYAFTLELSCDDPAADIEAMLGADAELLLDRNGLTRPFYGVIAEVDVELGPPEQTRARARLVPAFALLEQEVDTRFFTGQSVIEILRERLGEALAQFGRELDVDSRISSNDYLARDYCVQFRESTFAFCSRLMEEEGIAYVFVPDPESQRERMVLVDANAAYAAAELLAGGPLALVSHQPEELARESIQRFQWRRRRTSNRVVARGFNLKHPRQLDEGEAERLDVHNPRIRAVHLDGDRRQIVDDPIEDPQAERFTGAELGQRRAQAGRELEHRLVDAARGYGSSNAIGLGAGATIELAEAPAGVEPELLLVRVEHRASLDDAGEGLAYAYQNHFECIPRSRPFRPAQLTPRPRVSGVQTGVVVGRAGDEVHTDALGRVKVRFHRDRLATGDEHDSCWIRVAQAWAGPGYGAVAIPRVGMEVVVAFVDGNPDCPLITGCVYDGVNSPPHPLPSELARAGVKTSSSPGGEGFHELRLEDTAGKEQLFVHAQRRMDVRVKGTLFETATGGLEQVIGDADPGTAEPASVTLVKGDFNNMTWGNYLQYTFRDAHVQYDSLYQWCSWNGYLQFKEQVQLSTKRAVVETGEFFSLRSNDIVLSGSSLVTLKGGERIVIDSNDRIELRVGQSFVSIGPEGIAISGPSIRLNSGGQVDPRADEGVAVDDYEILCALEAYAADTGRDGGGGGGGGRGGRKREYGTREVKAIHAPPMKPPRAPPKQLIEDAGNGPRVPIHVAWEKSEAWCSDPLGLIVECDRGGDPQAENVRLTKAIDGTELRGKTIDLGPWKSSSHRITVTDILPRKTSSGRHEEGLDLLAWVRSLRTPVPLWFRFLPDLPPIRYESKFGGFNLRVENQTIVLGGTIEYVRGWAHWVIDLGDTVERGTGGRIGSNLNGHSRWRYAKSDPSVSNKMVFWDSVAWRPVPPSWESKMGTRRFGNAVWVEDGVTKTQYGTLPWPNPVPEWSATALRTKDTKLQQLEQAIESGWSEAFALKRKDCSSHDPSCCRYPILAEVKFVEVESKSRATIVLTENDTRASSESWSLTVSEKTSRHEFGHHLGNPDEYPGAATVDPGVWGDGAVRGIDFDGLMGCGSALRRRYFDLAAVQLTKLVQRETGKIFEYIVVPEASP